jgi:hypothetical protein
MKLASLETIVVALDSAKVRYLIVGGLAVAAHGFGRMTFDLDLVVQLHPQNAACAIEALQPLGYKPTVPVAASLFANAEIRQSWITEKGMVVFQLHSNLHPDTTIDLFVTEPFDFDAEYDRALIGELLPGRGAREGSGRHPAIEIAAGESMSGTDERSGAPDTDAAWAAHNLSQLLYFRSLSLREKLEAVQGMADVARRFREMREADRRANSTPATDPRSRDSPASKYPA